MQIEFKPNTTPSVLTQVWTVTIKGKYQKQHGLSLFEKTPIYAFDILFPGWVVHWAQWDEGRGDNWCSGNRGRIWNQLQVSHFFQKRFKKSWNCFLSQNLSARYWRRNARVQVLEPNPHFVKYFEETRKGVEPHLQVQDLLQVGSKCFHLLSKPNTKNTVKLVTE